MSDKEERLYIVRYPSRLIPEATGITVTRKNSTVNRLPAPRPWSVWQMFFMISAKDAKLMKNMSAWPKPPWTRWWINKDLFYIGPKKPLTVYRICDILIV